jgi:ribosome-binding factor A
VADRIAEELANLLQREVADPRLALLTVTGAEVDRELAYATVYVASMDHEQPREEILEALGGAQGFLRSRLAQLIQLRSFPRLRFRWDASLDQGSRIDDLLHRLQGGERPDESG